MTKRCNHFLQESCVFQILLGVIDIMRETHVSLEMMSHLTLSFMMCFCRTDPVGANIQNRLDPIPVWIQFDRFSSTSPWQYRGPSCPWGPPPSSFPRRLFLICGPPPHLRAFLKVWRSWLSQVPMSFIGRAWHACRAGVSTTHCLRWGGRCTCSEVVMLQGDHARLWTSTLLRYGKCYTHCVTIYSQSARTRKFSNVLIVNYVLTLYQQSFSSSTYILSKTGTLWWSCISSRF